MRIGLVDYDTTNVASSPSNSGIGLPLERLGLGPILEAFGARTHAKERRRAELSPNRWSDADVPVYHPAISFKFRPPTASLSNPSAKAKGSAGSSAPEEQSSSPLLTFSGRTMYFGSAHILRHALSALFSQTNVCIETVKLNRGPSQMGSDCSPQQGASTSQPQHSSPASNREAELVLRLTFSGSVRVTHQYQEYTVIFRYRFDPYSGMIIEHRVERIEPAPGKKIWAGLSNAFARLAGWQTPTPQPQTSTSAMSARATALAAWEGYAASPHPVLAHLPRLGSRSALDAKRMAALEWQRRRSYSTSTRLNASQQIAAQKDAREAVTTAPETQSTSASRSFFSKMTGASSAPDDMPGPSLSSVWFPRLGGQAAASSSESASATKVRHSIDGTSTTGSARHWAPASNDPTIVGREAVGPPAITTALSQYRPATGIQISNLSRVAVGLSKSNLTVLVTLTGMAGYALCPPALATLGTSTGVLGSVGTLLALTTGLAFCSASANTINQLREIPYDAQMARTRNRLLPSRAVSPLQAASFASATAVAGVGTLAAFLNPLTAVLGASNIVLYAFVYTPMKRSSIYNTWVGAVVGALPPLMGWTAVTDSLFAPTDAPAWCLAALLFAWQFPHFNSLAHNLSSEYARGGYSMMSVLDPSLNRRVALRYSLALIPICSIALPATGVVWGLPYAILSLPPNLWLLSATWKFWSKGDEKSARGCFWVSLMHLPAVMILAMALKNDLWQGVRDWWASGRKVSDGVEKQQTR